MPKKREIERLLKYRMSLTKLKGLGFENVFSYYLAEEIGISSEQIRKDLSNFKIKGRKKSGYNIEKLVLDIDAIIGKNSLRNIIILGMGNIGTALAYNTDFISNNIEIVAGFDINPIKLKKKYNIPVYPNTKMEEFVKDNNVMTAIIAVPALSAQQVCDQLVSYGIKGILNFAPRNLKTPENVFVNNAN